MKKSIFIFLSLLIILSCSNSETTKFISDTELLGEKIEISIPNSGIDTASGKISPTIKYKILGDDLVVNYPENTPTILLFINSAGPSIDLST